MQRILADFHVEDIQFLVEPAKRGFGDVSCNVAFLLAKRLKKSPKEIAQIIAERYREMPSTLVREVIPHASGYVNFLAHWEKLCRLILRASHLEEYGSIDLGGGSTVVVEHTSVNPNKALHIGHIRNIVIGDTISRILQKTNHKVNVLNYVDDSGLQVADIIIGFMHLGFSEEPPDGQKFDHYCGDYVYVQTSARYTGDQQLGKIRRDVLRDIEDWKSDTARLASRITRRVLSCQLETCWNLGVTYDCLNFESQIIRSGLWHKAFDKLKELGLAEYEDEGKNAGCWIIRGSDNEEDKVLVRSNGTATYVAKDIPYAAWKLGILDDPFAYIPYERPQSDNRILWQSTLDVPTEREQGFAGDRVITVIDSRQSRLQKIISSLMSEFKSAGMYIHLGYESVMLSSETANTLGLDTQGREAQMSGRKGLYVNADSVYEMLKSKATEETARRHPEMEDSEVSNIAHIVSVGALRYEMIKQDLDKKITFDMAKSLNLEGDTASYIQYTNARASRIIEKSGRVPSDVVDFSLLSEPAELELVRTIGLLQIQVRDAAKNLSPKVIARYCHDLAVLFNEFYEKVRVLGTDNRQLEDARLYLISSFRSTLGNALGLLGISAPDKM